MRFVGRFKPYLIQNKLFKLLVFTGGRDAKTSKCELSLVPEPPGETFTNSLLSNRLL